MSHELIGLPLTTPVRFGSYHSLAIYRMSDECLYAYMKFEVAPLARGYKWRPRAQLRSIARTELFFGGYRIDLRTAEATEMAFMEGRLTHYNDDMFAPLSAHEAHTYITPLTDVKIPLVALSHYEARLQMHFAALESLVERDPTILDPAPLVDPILSATVIYMAQYVTTSVRRHLTQDVITRPLYRQPTMYEIVDTSAPFIHEWVPEGNELTYTSVLVQAEDGTELPTDVVDRIGIIQDGYDRHRVSGFESRFMLRPPGVQSHIPSQNLYFLYYGTGQYALGLHNTHSLRLIVTFKRHFHSHVKVSIRHVTTGPDIIYEDGMGRILDSPGHDQDFVVPGRMTTARPTARPTLFTDVDSISVVQGTECLITLEPLTGQGQIGTQCHTCRKVFGLEALQGWLRETLAQTCPHCRTGTTFDRGPLIRDTS